RARRAAERQGLVLVKSRRRDPRALGFGRFVIKTSRTGRTVAGGALDTDRALTLVEVEAYLDRRSH
ncbi:MAG TPA: hypothetical protein VFI46_11720, partial [Jiangellaceae bacterium]|nr:hypothetical protein [Jiangellaceae bacterium]